MANVVEITFAADGTKVVRMLRDMDNAIERIDKKTQVATGQARGMGAAFSKIGDIGKRVLFGVLAAGLAAVGKAVAAVRLAKLGSDLLEIENRFSEVFRGVTQTIEEFEGKSEALSDFSSADQFADKAALTKSELKDLLADSGAILQQFGIEKKLAASLAADVLKISGDLASFRDRSTREAVQAINDALVGERERLKSLGIVLREEDVERQALLQTRKASARLLTLEEKAYASLTLIIDRAGAAVADLARTADQPANVLKRLQARARGLGEELGKKLVPGLAIAGDTLLDALGNPRTLALIGKLGDLIGDVFTKSVEVIKSAAATVIAWADDNQTALSGVFKLLRTLGEIGQTIFTALSAVILKNVASIVVSLGQWANKNEDLLRLVRIVFAAIARVVAFNISLVLTVIKGVAKNVDRFILDPINRVVGAVRRAKSVLDRLLGRGGSSAGGGASGSVGEELKTVAGEAENVAVASEEADNALASLKATADQTAGSLNKTGQGAQTAKTRIQQLREEVERYQRSLQDLGSLENREQIIRLEAEAEQLRRRLKNAELGIDEATRTFLVNERSDAFLSREGSIPRSPDRTVQTPSGSSLPDPDQFGIDTSHLLLESELKQISDQQNAFQQAGEDLVGAFAQGLGAGDFTGMGSNLLLAVARLAEQLGQSMVQFGLAGVAIGRLVKNPYLALAAGGALLALSARLKKTAQKQVDAATSGSTIQTGTNSSITAIPAGAGAASRATVSSAPVEFAGFQQFLTQGQRFQREQNAKADQLIETMNRVKEEVKASAEKIASRPSEVQLSTFERGIDAAGQRASRVDVGV